MNKNKRILVGMSGGVDSSVAALLLHQQGYEVEGAYMKNWINEENVIGNCPWMQDIEDARAVAETIGIPFRVVNMMKDYRERIVNYLLKGYSEGITPNPDVMCNREMKFGVFRDFALAEGFDAVATGHYARLQWNGERAEILEGCDGNKDQTYFLALLNQEQAASACFPIGGIPKPEVRKIAEKAGLPTAAKKDSQGICFIGEVKMSDFLKTFLDNKPGPIVNLEGKVLGEHEGLHLYTIGQRKRIRVPSNTPNKAYVVVEKRRQSNELVIGFDEIGSAGLYADRCIVTNLSWVNEPIDEEREIEARPRYRAARERISIKPLGDGRAEVTWHQPQRALTTGQICAFYDGERLMGGSVFAEIFPVKAPVETVETSE